MKDAFGGTFMLNIMIVFFVVFVSFMSVAVTLTKTFRVKADVSSYLTRNDITPEILNNSSEVSNIQNYLMEMGYRYPDSSYSFLRQDCIGKSNGGSYTYIDGICIIPVETSDDNGREIYYYKVYSYVVINPPVFHINMNLSFKSESRSIYK